MKRAMLAAAVGLAVLSRVDPAAAHWGYTRWGMTPAEVEASSDGVARTNADRTLDADGVRAELVAPFQGQSLSFTAVFLFDGSSRLRYVSLKPVSQAACAAVMQALAAHYGRPDGGTDMIDARTMRWDDLTDDNLVIFLDLGAGHCSVQYSKLPATKPNGKGL